MAFNYSVHSVEAADPNPDPNYYLGMMRLKFTVHTRSGNKITSFMDISQDELGKYEGVSNQHYLDGEDIIVIRDVMRLITVDNDGTYYRRAYQSDYDKWMDKKFPDSFNAVVYRSLCRSFGG